MADNQKLRTDWEAYYRRPYKTAQLTRKYTTWQLIRFMKKYLPAGRPVTLAEMGGANSCFFEEVNRQIRPSAYHIFDNSKLGLDLSRERISATNVVLHEQDVLEMRSDLTVDLAFSVGLIEHFDPANTKKAVQAHLHIVNPGSIVLISYPTPTFLYRATRFLSELFHMWIFHDERPIQLDELTACVAGAGTICEKKILWPLLLTQQMVVIRKCQQKLEFSL